MVLDAAGLSSQSRTRAMLKLLSDERASSLVSPRDVPRQGADRTARVYANGRLFRKMLVKSGNLYVECGRRHLRSPRFVASGLLRCIWHMQLPSPSVEELRKSGRQG